MTKGIKVIFSTQNSANRTRNKLRGPEEASSERSLGDWLGGIASLSCCRLFINMFYLSICYLFTVFSKIYISFYYRHVSILGFMKKGVTV